VRTPAAASAPFATPGREVGPVVRIRSVCVCSWPPGRTPCRFFCNREGIDDCRHWDEPLGSSAGLGVGGRSDADDGLADGDCQCAVGAMDDERGACAANDGFEVRCCEIWTLSTPEMICMKSGRRRAVF
jgi:hypothetical protein